MLKYVDTLVTFAELPNEVSLCINISGCPNHCIDCHSKYLWDDIGEVLSEEVLSKLISNNYGISCVCLMGGDQEPQEVSRLIKFIKENYPELHTAWYSGNTKISKDIDTKYFDYIKYGPYFKEFGPLTSETTNQRLMAKGYLLHKMDANDNMFYDITDKFWK